MKAACACGQLTVNVPGPTTAVVACHCLACQRRTGSPFGVAAYYPHDQVRVDGKAVRYERLTALDGVFETYFCPTCGSSVYFKGSKNPDVTGVAIGCFRDPHEMVPVRSVWEEAKHAWLDIPTAIQHFEKGRV